MSDTQKVSYCATHNTYPEPNTPCWQCANPYIREAYKSGLRDAIERTAMTKEEYMGAQITSLYHQGFISKEEYEDEMNKLKEE